jgi:hypothetical protein
MQGINNWVKTVLRVSCYLFPDSDLSVCGFMWITDHVGRLMASMPAKSSGKRKSGGKR